jgi:hypothetical protein
MSNAAVPHEVGLLEDLADPEEAALTPQDNDDLERLLLARNPRFQALMAQAQESIKVGKTLSSDEFWAQVHQRAAESAADHELALAPPAAPAIAEPKPDFHTDSD